MLKNWRINSGIKSCTGIEIHIISEGKFNVRKVELLRDRESLNIVAREKIECDISTLGKLKFTGPVSVVFTGKGTLIKKIEMVTSISENTFSNVFPNINIEEFYTQNFISGKYSYVSLIRKTIVDTILDLFIKHDVIVYQIGIGPFSISHVLTQLNHYSTQLNVDHHHIELNEDGSWNNYEYKFDDDDGFDLKLDLEPIEKHFILAYSFGFQLILSESLDIIQIENVAKIADLTELNEAAKFKKYGIVMLCSFFLILLVNFFVSSHYRNANSDLELNYNRNTNLTSVKQKLEQDEISLKDDLSRLNWNGLQGYAFICDQIGQSIPEKLVLRNITVNSSANENKSFKTLQASGKDKIFITGTTPNVYDVNEWIYKLKVMPWIKNVYLNKFVTDEIQGNQVFTIIINF